MEKLTGIALLLMLALLPVAAHAIHAPPARILDARTTPVCVTVVPAFWLNKTLSKYTGGEGPAIAVKNTCEKPIVVTSVLIAAKAEAEKTAEPQLGLALHSDADGYYGAFMVADGDDCAAPLAHNREANKTRCKNMMVSPGETLTMPMQWGYGFTVSGQIEDKTFTVDGVLVDPTKPKDSMSWLIKAAERGDRDSQLELGNLYTIAGPGQDKQAAVKWWLKAAEQGLPLAQFKAAQALDTGDGVTRDLAAAAKWYEKAASSGETKGTPGLAVQDAKCRLGTMYAEGLGVTADDEKMASWWEVPAVNVLKLKPKALEGDAEAQLALGNLLRPNMGCRRQTNAEAAKWYRKAAEQGVTDAEYYIGRLYDAGEGLARDDKEALTWYNRAAAKGHAQAMYQLGVLYARKHDGMPPDYERSLKWLKLAGARGHTLSAYHLARLYANGGKGVTQDYAEAFFWYSIPLRFEGQLDDKPGMSDVGEWRLSVIDPYAGQRDKMEAKLTPEQSRAVRERVRQWQPASAEDAAAEAAK